MKEYLLYVGVTWVFKKLLDWGAKKAPGTQTKIDDVVVDFGKTIFEALNGRVKKKFSK